MKSLLLHPLVLASTLLIPAMTTAQVDRTKAPAPGPAPEVHLGGHKSFMLDNGMRVIIVENHKIPIVSAQLRFDIPPVMQGDKAGYQELVGELLTSGTARHTKAELDEMVDSLGARLSGANDGLYASSLKKNFPALMNIVYEVASSAMFPGDEFDKAKTRMLSQISARAEDPDQIADVVGHALTFGKHYPYGEVTTAESVGKAKRDDVYAYYRYFFQPKNGYLVLVGDISAAEGEAMAKRYFGLWKGADVAVTKDAEGHDVVKGLGPIITAGAQPPLRGKRVAFVDRPGSAQSVIKVLFPVDLKPNDPMAMQAQVLNTILGGGVFNARLMQNLREDKGYTYGAYSSLDADRWCGSFSAGCSVRNAVTDSAVTEIMKEIANIRTAPVKADELALAKSYMAGSFARSLEDPRTVARFALNTYLNKLPEDHYETYLNRLNAVTIADVQQAAERFLHPDSAVILVVGDKETVAKTLEPLANGGHVLYYDANGDIVRPDPTEGATPAPAGMTAQDVLDAYIKAIGGKDAVQKVRDVRKVYTTTVQGMTATLTEYNKAPNKYAMEMMAGEMLVQRISYDGGDKGKLVSMMGEKELVDTDLDEVLQSAYAFPELHYGDLQYSAKLLGIVDIDGKKAYRVNVQTLPGGRFDEYYDVQSGLKLRRKESKTQEGGGYIQVVTDFSDYKPEGGVLFPHTLHQGGGVDMVLNATSIAVNQGIADSTFSVE
jgi:predicted Zn-dependent peptidase